MEDLKAWDDDLKITIGPLAMAENPTGSLLYDTLKLLWQYRHLNGGGLNVLPCTDLIVHRASVVPGSKPDSVKHQKRYHPQREWWLKKLMEDGIRGG